MCAVFGASVYQFVAVAFIDADRQSPVIQLPLEERTFIRGQVAYANSLETGKRFIL